MRKAELVAFIADRADILPADAERAVEAIFDAIGAALARGDSINLIGFGTFERRERGARRGKNPQTGVSMEIAASVSVGFRPGKPLRELFN